MQITCVFLIARANVVVLQMFYVMRIFVILRIIFGDKLRTFSKYCFLMYIAKKPFQVKLL